MTERSRTIEIPPVRKSVRVDRPRAETFRAFTSGMGKWWPLATHSVGGASKRIDLVFEAREGGRVYERHEDGSEHDWGRVLRWEPDAAFEMTWHPGRDPSSAQRLRVDFREDGKGTRVELVHSGWERLGEQGAESREGYETGWDPVLAHFTGYPG